MSAQAVAVVRGRIPAAVSNAPQACHGGSFASDLAPQRIVIWISSKMAPLGPFQMLNIAKECGCVTKLAGLDIPTTLLLHPLHSCLCYE